MINLVICLFAGVFIGVAITALMVMAKCSDCQAERERWMRIHRDSGS